MSAAVLSLSACGAGPSAPSAATDDVLFAAAQPSSQTILIRNDSPEPIQAQVVPTFFEVFVDWNPCSPSCSEPLQPGETRRMAYPPSPLTEAAVYWWRWPIPPGGPTETTLGKLVITTPR